MLKSSNERVSLSDSDAPAYVACHEKAPQQVCAYEKVMDGAKMPEKCNFNRNTINKATLSRVRPHLHIPSMTPFLVSFNNGFGAVQWCCLHVMSKRSKVPLTKKGDVDGMCKRTLTNDNKYE